MHGENTVLHREIEQLNHDYAALQDEVWTLRPFARLAYILSMSEGENQRLHKNFVATDRDVASLLRISRELVDRVTALEKWKDSLAVGAAPSSKSGS